MRGERSVIWVMRTVLLSIALLVASPTFASADVRVTAPQATPPALYVVADLQPIVKRALPFALHLLYGNRGTTTVTGVAVTIDVPDDVGIGELPAGCNKAGAQQIVCALGSVAPRVDVNDNHVLLVPLVAPDVSEAPVTITGTARSDQLSAEGDAIRFSASTTTYRTLNVTTTADAGEGSLRNAIEVANGFCDADHPCQIAFRIEPAGPAAWQTIRVLSPLPALRTNDVLIDGTTETRFYGDRNPAGPEIELQGSALGDSGSGLVIDVACSVTVQGLAINGFPEAGLLLRGPSCSGNPYGRQIVDNYIGCDPTGTKAVPNGRGIVVDAERFWPYQIRGNVISGNRRSGIFVQKGAVTTIDSNVIGLTPAHAPLGNGASGVFIGAGGSGATVVGNLIGFNHDSGVSIARDAQYVSVEGNSIQGNWQLAIDVGLDGVSPSVPVNVNDPSRSIEAPEITLARYDAASDRTIIEGTATGSDAIHFEGSVSVQLYANDAPDESGYGEGQYPLGAANVDADSHFRFSWPGRLPGPWVAGTTKIWALRGFAATPAGGLHSTTDFGGDATSTSEFGRTVRVAD